MSLALHRRIPGLRNPYLKLDAARAKRDAALAERNTAVAERDAALAERNTAVAERDAALAERNTAVAERDAALAERNTAVAERDAALAERNLFYLKASYERLVAYCKKQSPLDEAMRSAVGGEFDLIGDIECAILQYYGLEPTHYLIELAVVPEG